MPVKFETFTPSTGIKEKDVPTDYVRITKGSPPPPPVVDEIFRKATDEDRAQYAAEYAAFKTAPVTRAEAAQLVAAEPPPAGFMKGFFKGEEHKPKHTKHKTEK